jgi:hypothetical protein
MQSRMEKNIVLWRENRRTLRLMPTGKERREITTMKYLAIIALAALAIGLNACSSSTPPSTTTTSTASTGYSK